MSYSNFLHFLRSRFPGENIESEHEDGKHIARVSGTIKLVANTTTPYVTVIWGSGHKAIIRV